MIDSYIVENTSWDAYSKYCWDRFRNQHEVHLEKGQICLCERDMAKQLRVGHKKVRVRITTLVRKKILKAMIRVGKSYGAI
jgi:hypothetical protein